MSDVTRKTVTNVILDEDEVRAALKYAAVAKARRSGINLRGDEGEVEIVHTIDGRATLTFSDAAEVKSSFPVKISVPQPQTYERQYTSQICTCPAATEYCGPCPKHGLLPIGVRGT